MTKRGKHKLLLSSWLGLYFLLGLGVWEFQAGHLFLLLYFAASVLIYGLYVFSERCPNCKMPVLARPLRIFGMHVYLWSILIPARCRHCGALIQ